MIEWFDDFALGMKFKSGTRKVTEEDIKRFAANSIRNPCILMTPRRAKPCSRVWQPQAGTRPALQ